MVYPNMIPAVKRDEKATLPYPFSVENIGLVNCF